jgi:DNA invertase Pin-like site-specific DNA recombinase
VAFQSDPDKDRRVRAEATQVGAERRRVDTALCEALDRRGRKLADIAELFDRLSFASVKLHMVATGEVTALHIGMLGTVTGHRGASVGGRLENRNAVNLLS